MLSRRWTRNEYRSECLSLETWYEELATCQEEALETYLETGTVSEAQIRAMIRDREVFPCYFGSALKMEGIETFLNGFEFWTARRYLPSVNFLQKCTRFPEMSRATV